MKRLIEVTREQSRPNSMYLLYVEGQVAYTTSLDGEDHYVNVDRDASGDVMGIEIVFPDDKSVDLVARFALENALSIEGAFVS